MMGKFWWGHKDNLSKTAWMSWKKMSLAKDEGGLGFCDLELFNKALIAKQGWRILQHPESLAGKVLKEKYFQNSSFLESNLERIPSYAWCNIWNGKSILMEGMIWQVGDGKTIRIWEDRWIPSTSTNRIQSPNFSFPSNAWVDELIDYGKRWWNVQILQELFSEEETGKLCSLAICLGRRSDQLVWGGTKNGVYSVRSGYHLAKESVQMDEASCSSWQSNREL